MAAAGRADRARATSARRLTEVGRRPRRASARRTSSRTTGSPPARASSSPPTATRPSPTRAACLAGRRAGRGRGVPRRARGLAVLPHRRRARSCRWPRRRTSSGSATATPAPTPAAWAPTRRCDWAPAGLVDEVVAPGRPADRRRDAPPRHAVRRRALRRAGAHRARPAGDRVQRPLRRPRDPGRPRPARDAARRRCCSPRPTGRLAEFGPLRWSDDAAVTVVVAADGLPGHAAHRRPDRRGCARPTSPAASTSCTPARRSTTTAVVSAGGRVLSVVALGADLAEARRAAYAGVAGSSSTAGTTARDIALRLPRRGHRPDPAGGAVARRPARRNVPGVRAPELPGYGTSTRARSATSTRRSTGHRRGPARTSCCSSPPTGSRRYDYVLDSDDPGQGRVLTQLSLWWFEQLADVVPNHVVSTDVPAAVAGRAVLVPRALRHAPGRVRRPRLPHRRRAGGVPRAGAVCGRPAARRAGRRVAAAEPIFTPDDQGAARRARPADVVRRTSRPRSAPTLAAAAARAHPGDPTPRQRDRRASAASSSPTPRSSSAVDRRPATIVLADEVLTPDSSRFWPADAWEPGRRSRRSTSSSSATGSPRRPPAGTGPPARPRRRCPTTSSSAPATRYVEAYERLTGRAFA